MYKGTASALSFRVPNPAYLPARTASTLPAPRGDPFGSRLQTSHAYGETRSAMPVSDRLPFPLPLTSPMPARPVHCDVGIRFGDRLRGLRRGSNMTQVDMSVAFGIDRSYISDVECGKTGISLATLEVVALGFHIPLSELLRDL